MIRDDWNEKGQRNLVTRVTEFSKNLLEKAEPMTLPEHMIMEMDSRVNQVQEIFG